jgi:hypothetical protein
MPALPQLDDNTAKKIIAMIRMLLSDQPGEAGNALQALGRTLRAGGKDLVDAVAERIGRSELSEADYQMILDEGIKIGKAQAGRPTNGHGPPKSGPQFPSAYDMAMFCQARLDRLDEWHQEFIPSIIAKRLRHGFELYPRQQSKLEEAYLSLGGPLR